MATMSRKKLSKLGIILGLSERIRKVRGHLSQEEFGYKLGGLQKSTISRYEKGRIPDEETLNNIANYGNTTMEWLLKGDEGQTPQFPESPPEVCGVRPGPPLDVALLAEILAEIKEFITAEHLELSSKREARWVALVYDHCQEDKVKPDRMLVERFLWITKVD
jgi:transcriptional regulator with XRE-family HTH domain